MVLSKLGDLVPTNGAEQDEPINCFYDEINDCRGYYCMAMAVMLSTNNNQCLHVSAAPM
jgi:hypothetical protein